MLDNYADIRWIISSGNSFFEISVVDSLKRIETQIAYNFIAFQEDSFHGILPIYSFVSYLSKSNTQNLRDPFPCFSLRVLIGKYYVNRYANILCLVNMMLLQVFCFGLYKEIIWMNLPVIGLCHAQKFLN